MSKVSDRIKECREEHGLSVDELSRIIGKNRATVYRYEKDDIGDIPINVIHAMALALDVNPAYLMGWSEDKTPARYQEPVTQLDDEHAKLIERYDALDQKRKDRLMAFLEFLESGTGR